MGCKKPKKPKKFKFEPDIAFGTRQAEEAWIKRFKEAEKIPYKGSLGPGIMEQIYNSI